MHWKDGLQLIGRSPLAGFWVVRPDLIQQTLPPNQHLHPLQKALPPRLTLLGLVLKVHKVLSTLSIPAKLQSGLYLTAHRSILPPPRGLIQRCPAVL